MSDVPVSIDAAALVRVLADLGDDDLRPLLERLDALRPVRPPDHRGDYLNADEAAAILRVNKRRVYGLVGEGRLGRHGPGRKLLVSRTEVESLARGEEPRRLPTRWTNPR